MKLIEITAEDQLVCEYQGQTLRLALLPGVRSACYERVGQWGWAMIARAPAGVTGPVYLFHAYLDQSMRRAYELDGEEYQDEERSPYCWGWRNAKRPGGFRAPSHVVPGIDGEFIEDETQLLKIAVPPEFEALCARYRRDAHSVLRGFIADACGLRDMVRCPRADGYCNNGSDERRLAEEYLERTCSMVEAVEDA